MKSHSSTVVATELARTVLVKNYFYRVRMEAVGALVAVGCTLPVPADKKYSSSECEYIGLFFLLKLCQSFYCRDVTLDEEPVDADVSPQPNDFEIYSEYFLKKVSLSERDLLISSPSFPHWGISEIPPTAVPGVMFERCCSHC